MVLCSGATRPGAVLTLKDSITAVSGQRGTPRHGVTSGLPVRAGEIPQYGDAAAPRTTAKNALIVLISRGGNQVLFRNRFGGM